MSFREDGETRWCIVAVIVPFVLNDLREHNSLSNQVTGSVDIMSCVLLQVLWK
jgi:hypothetical protein